MFSFLMRVLKNTWCNLLKDMKIKGNSYDDGVFTSLSLSFLLVSLAGTA